MSRNPFDDRNDEDPFADPFGDSSIVSALDAGGPNARRADDEQDAVPLHSVGRSEARGGYFPGGGGSYKPVGAGVDADDDAFDGSSGGAYPIDDSSSAKHGTQALGSREAELRRREEALAARERELRTREANVQALAAGARPPLNFPPLYPIMYHAIDAEVPAGDRGTVRTIFYLWLALEAMLALNCVACLVVMVSNAKDVSNSGASFGSSFVYLFTISAGSFFLWYRPVYNAYMKDSSMFFYLFFIFNGFHILFDAYMAVGVPGAGSAGMIIMLQCLSSDKKAGAALAGICFSLWTLHFMASLAMFFRVRRHYRRRGHTFAEAKQQAYLGFAQSGAGQAAASTAANAYIRSNTGNFV
ncbi:hypothetical protein LPJ61_001050 [Coemansia biformis]|uniref:Scamp-domain-containing protein n=1 Tax=Coemansia biformis TaxID=1286918 RepID=A0A9W8CXN5_9FUNG|nr:hypothetical protein LPJ61_001050 [Coemansia biformis]